MVLVVEVAMKKCIVREKQKSSVDFLTEFVRRVCDARANRMGRMVNVYMNESRHTMKPKRNICELRMSFALSRGS